MRLFKGFLMEIPHPGAYFIKCPTLVETGLHRVLESGLIVMSLGDKDQ